MGNIIVQLAEPHWTRHTLHLASALARNTQSSITLLHLMVVRHPGLLGSDIAASPPTMEAHTQFEDYAFICEDYGVPCVLQSIQYISFIEALQDAASILNANVLFAKKPQSPVKIWNTLQTWWLTRCIQSTGCKLYLIDGSTNMLDWIPEHLVEDVRQPVNHIPG